MVMEILQKIEAMNLRIQKSVFKILKSVLMPRITAS